MNDVNFFLGYPVDFKQLCLVYPPKVKEVVSVKDYATYIHIFTITQEEIEDEFVELGKDLNSIINPFEYLLNLAYNNKKIFDIINEGFNFFIHEPVTILFEQKEIIIGDLKNGVSLSSLRVLKEEDYFDFQNLIRESIGQKPIELPKEDEDPRIKAMKAKARYRDKIKAKQGKGLTLKTLLSSICCMNLGLNPLNIGELSYAALLVLLSCYQEKEKYDIDIRSLLAGADSKKVKPKYWIRNLDE